MDKLNQYVLGEPSELIAVTSSEDNRFATIAMLRQAKRNLDIVSRCLDSSIYDDAEVVEAIKALSLRGRYLRIRILVLDIAPIVSGGHRLVGLAMRLSSFIEIRRQDPEQVPCNEAFLIVDETGVILRKLSGRYEGRASFNDRKLGGELSSRFEEMWQRAHPDRNFRWLGI